MINFFLKAKHWQLFLLFFVLPFCLYSALIVYLIPQFESSTLPEMDNVATLTQYLFSVVLIFMGLLFCWFWSVTIGLQKKIPSDIKMNVMRFKIFFFVPLVYMVFLFYGMGYFISNMFELGEVEQLESVASSIMLIIVPLHFFSFFCIIHTMYFTAKTFKTAELQQEVRFSDYIAEFFMLWFYIIGIWIIQPKINEMINRDNKNLIDRLGVR